MTMEIDRYMVNLFFEIKRNLPISKRESMKISNPELGEIMVDVYKTTSDENIKRLAEVFLERAGDKWLAKIRTKKPFYQSTPAIKTRQTDDAIQTPTGTAHSKAATQKRLNSAKPRYYRGVLLED